MPLHKIQIQPGVNQQQTQTANTASWFASNLIRFRDGTVERIGGWQRLANVVLAGLGRAIHAFQDLQNNLNLAIGGDGGLQIYNSGTLYTLSFSNTNTVTAAQNYSFTAFGNAVNGTNTTYTVNATGVQPVVGQTVTFTVGFFANNVWFPAGTTVTVASTPTASSWTFTGVLTSNLAVSGPNISQYFTTAGSSLVVVGAGQNVANPVQSYDGSTDYPGFKVGGTYVVGQAVVPNDVTKSVNIPPGSYTVTAKGPGAGQFTIQTNIVQASTAIGYEGAATPQYTFVYGGSNVTGIKDWFLDNLGNNLVIAYTNSSLYVWKPPVASLSVASNVSTAPLINAGMLVAMPQAQVILWGTEPIIGSGVTDPLLIRFSDAGSFSTWTATSINQAGSYRLSQGSKIVGGIQLALLTLIWTDTDLWGMQYVGPPFVYNFTTLAKGCGLISPKARAILGGTCYWMSKKQFWSIGAGGGGASPIYCPVWDVIFNDIDLANINKIQAGANSAYGEVFFYYPSISGGTGEVDKYVKLTRQVGGTLVWDYGTLARTTWLDQSVFGNAIGIDINKRIQQHDIGYDADGVAMAGAFVESGFADLNDGDSIEYVDQIIPDMKWFGSVPGAVEVTLKGVKYPQGPASIAGPVGINSSNPFIRLRMRARSISMRLDWIARLGYNARVGAIRVRSAFAGRRP